MVVTAEAGDDEMIDRIARHRADRPSNWLTVEAPRDLPERVGAVDPDHTLLLDCVSFWIANLVLGDDTDAEIERRIDVLASTLADRRDGPTIVVTNEVGQGIVPADSISRRFRDLNGQANRALATVLDRSLLVVAGQVVELSGIGGDAAR